jgi:predicted component of type VI protein secretion system
MGIAMALSACSLPERVVFLNKVDFEVAAEANNGKAFVCHIVVAYSQDLLNKLQAMDAAGYFSAADTLSRTHKDAIEVHQFDLIPGRNKLGQEISVGSRTKAKGAFLFAKYLQPGKFTENVGGDWKITVRFLPYKMEIHRGIDLETLTKKLEGQ